MKNQNGCFGFILFSGAFVGLLVTDYFALTVAEYHPALWFAVPVTLLYIAFFGRWNRTQYD